MKKIFIKTALVAGFLMAANPAHALFTNGGFEAGDFNGWTITYGNVRYTNTSTPDWSGPYTGSRYYTGQPYPTAQVVTSATTYPGQTLDVNPYNGTYMARINDIGGDYDATRLSQSDTIAADDIGDTLYVNWGAMLVDPSHPAGEQPFFSITVSKNGAAISTFSADATDAAASGWTVAGSDGYSPLYYKAGQYTYNLSTFSLGDLITVDMFVADCGYGGHGGYAFLDGIGTEYVKPPDDVPEPATMLLFGTGLAGLVGSRIRRKATK